MIPDLSQKKIILEGKRASYFYPTYSVAKQFTYKKGQFLHFADLINTTHDHFASWNFMFDDEKIFDKYLLCILEKKNWSKELEDYILKIKNDMLHMLKQDKAIKEKAKYYYNQYEQLMISAGFLRGVDRALRLHLPQCLPHKDDLAVIAVSDRLTFSAREEQSLLKKASQLKKQKRKATKDDVKEIQNTFCWSVLGYYDEQPITTQEYVNKINLLIEQNPELLLTQREQHLKDSLAQREKIVIQLDKKAKDMADVAAHSTFIKDLFKSSANEVQYHAELLFLEIAKQTKNSVGFIKDLLPDEVGDLLSGKRVDKNMVEQRNKNGVVFALGGNIYVLYGKEAVAFEEKYMPKIKNEEKIFSGRIACKGYAKGKAKIVLGVKDFHKLQKGDILIVSNTSPDFMPILSKAAAIVAEEGGITAHVSVVSRELGIPCVVGIHHIINYLKDNDLIEVDANKGIVRKIA